MPGYWKRPTCRTYSYNLNLGEHYYYPLTSYLETERGSRGEAPGALTYSERLARKWVTGRTYDPTELRDRYSRARSVAFDEASTDAEMAARRAMRAASEIRTSATSAAMQRSSAAAAESYSAREEILSRQESSRRQTAQRESLLQSSVKSTSTRRQKDQLSSTFRNVYIDDDMCKKVADARMNPWDGNEAEDARMASMRARARIMELEKELEEITRKALMTSTKALKSASQLAAQANFEDDMRSSSVKKSKKIMIESSSKIVR